MRHDLAINKDIADTISKISIKYNVLRPIMASVLYRIADNKLSEAKEYLLKNTQLMMDVPEGEHDAILFIAKIVELSNEFAVKAIESHILILK